MSDLVMNGDFSNGNKKFESDYTHVTGAAGSDSGAYPAYAVVGSPVDSPSSLSDWADFGDHTSGSGKMLVLNGGPGDLWREDISLVAGKAYTFTLWAAHALTGANGFGALPVLQFYADGQAIGASLTVQGPQSSAGWQELQFVYKPTAPTTEISIRDATTAQAYNDFAVDDISIKTGRHLDPAASVPAHAFGGALHGSIEVLWSHGAPALDFTLHHAIA